MCIGPSSLVVTDPIGKNQMCKRGIVWNLLGIPIFLCKRDCQGNIPFMWWGLLQVGCDIQKRLFFNLVSGHCEMLSESSNPGICLNHLSQVHIESYQSWWALHTWRQDCNHTLWSESVSELILKADSDRAIKHWLHLDYNCSVVSRYKFGQTIQQEIINCVLRSMWYRVINPLI